VEEIARFFMRNSDFDYTLLPPEFIA